MVHAETADVKAECGVGPRSFQDRLVWSALPSRAPCSWVPELNSRVVRDCFDSSAVEFGNPGAAVVAAGTTVNRGSQPTYAIVKRPRGSDRRQKSLPASREESLCEGVHTSRIRTHGHAFVHFPVWTSFNLAYFIRCAVPGRICLRQRGGRREQRGDRLRTDLNCPSVARDNTRYHGHAHG